MLALSRRANSRCLLFVGYGRTGESPFIRTKSVRHEPLGLARTLFMLFFLFVDKMMLVWYYFIMNIKKDFALMIKTKNIFISILAVFCAIILTVTSLGGCNFSTDTTDKVFEINDTLTDGQNKKATVILLGGQSNASGCSLDSYLQKNVSEEKYAEYANGYDNVYINYYATGNNESKAFVKCKTGQGEPGCFGPELGLAEKLNELYPDQLFFIIKCAWGGTNLYKQWLSPSSLGVTGQLYKEFVNFVDTSLNYLTSKNYDVNIEAMCWMQGESDSILPITAVTYKINLNNFIKDIRKQFSSYAPADGIAFVDAFIANTPKLWLHCNIINAKKQAVANESPLNVVVDTSILTCSEEPTETPDLAHYDSLSQIKLGQLFAEQIVHFL